MNCYINDLTYPSLNDAFAGVYQRYSVKNRDLVVPDHFDIYHPDNQDDFSCFSVLSPSLQRAATEWTLNGRWISIGVYRDEGRPVSSGQNVEFTWTKSADGTKIIIDDLHTNHLLRVGMLVNLTSTTLDPLLLGVEVQQILSPRSFSVAFDSAWNPATSGIATWRLANTRGFSTPWSRSGGEVMFTTLDFHELHVGDPIDVANINVDQFKGLTVHQVYSPNIFSVFHADLDVGALSGSAGTWQPINPEIFYEQNSVFRLLPSFKLVPVSVVQAIFDLTAPDPNPQRRSLFNITTEQDTLLPNGKTKSINYDVPAATVPRTSRVSLETRFEQIYDKTGVPLEIIYREDGNPVEVNNVDSRFKNERSFLNPALVNEGDEDDTVDEIVHAYDFYGFPLNAHLEPYHSEVIIERDTAVPAPRDNVKRQETNSEVVIYTGKIFDVFGNQAVGIQENNALNVKKSILPLQLDRFNKPVKTPVKRRT